MRLPAYRRALTPRPPAGGSIFVEDASLAAPAARILWLAEHDPSVVAVAAEPVRSDSPDRFELASLRVPTTSMTLANGHECLAISDGLRRIRLDVESGTLREGPVRLRHQLAGIEGVDAKLVTLRRLMALTRLGRFGRSLDAPKSSRTRKLTLSLHAYDLASAGATQREIAAELIGEAWVAAEWRTNSDSLRYRVLRLLRNAEAHVNGGYLKLLRSL